MQDGGEKVFFKFFFKIAKMTVVKKTMFFNQKNCHLEFQPYFISFLTKSFLLNKKQSVLVEAFLLSGIFLIKTF
jgi:hypothetical protein